MQVIFQKHANDLPKKKLQVIEQKIQVISYQKKENASHLPMKYNLRKI